ncbi:MAG: hypothetical protein PHN69_00760 [Candidatus Pacebacteria bacterium]|nr:hypothetical protein [Candidatus Paceibacterota bacterium]
MNIKKTFFLGLLTFFFLILSVPVFSQTEGSLATSKGFIQSIIDRIAGDAERASDNFYEPTSGPGYPNEAVFPDGQPSFTQSGYINTNNSSISYNSYGGVGMSCNVGNVTSFRTLLETVVGCVFTPLVYLIIGLSVVIFLWGVFKFIRSDGEDKSSGREFMFWGIVGIFVMVSVWGLVNILSYAFLLDNSSIKVREIRL